jgi:hypothetical protein
MATPQRTNPHAISTHQGEEIPDDPFTRQQGNSVEIDTVPNPFNSDMEDYALPLDRVTRLEENLSIPGGQYHWDTLNGKLMLTVRKRFITDDTEPQDCSREGRLIYNVSGICKPVQEGRSGRFMFDMSPDLRYRYDKSGVRIQPLTSDFLNDNWAKFTKLFFTKYERNPEGTREVLTMVEKGKYFMYVTLNSTGSNYLGSLKGM